MALGDSNTGMTGRARYRMDLILTAHQRHNAVGRGDGAKDDPEDDQVEKAA